MQASFYALPSLNPVQQLVFASADPATGGAGIQYMDMTGIGVGNSVSPWDFSTLAAPWERWIAPPVDGTNQPKVLTTKPAKSTTLMIRRPTWSASALRVTWKGVPGRFIAQSTQFCEWFSITFYAGIVPSSIVLNHPFQDTVFGSVGLEPGPADYSTYAHWISVPSQTTADTLWLNTLGTQKSPSATRPGGSEVTVCGDKVLAFKVYDYKLPGTYFPFSEKTNSDMIKGLVGPTLGSDGLPTYTGKSTCGNGDPKSTECTAAGNGPNNWFKKNQYNTTGCLLQPLKLNSTTGKYEYSNSDYFPLDTLIKDPAYNESMPPSQTQSHDFGFCLHAKSTFEYVPGLSFSFRGDDDVWVFIDKKLALDLGGQHGPIAGDINLDKLSLLEGRAYQFDMFYCERHTPGSNILIQTTMNLVPSYDFRFDSTVVTGTSTLKIDLNYIKTEIDGSKCQDDATQTPIRGKGFFFLQYPDGHSVPLPEPPLASGLSGVAIDPSLSSIQVDLAAVKKDPSLTQRGWYKIVIRFQNDPSQANVKEIPFEISRGPVDLTADLFDTDGDGKADSLVYHAPDTVFKGSDLKSLRAVWSKASGARDSLVVGATSIRVLAGDSVAIVDWGASSPFQKRSSCPLGGCVSMGLATTIPYLPDSVRNPVRVFREHIAPFADSAYLSFGGGAAPDTLWVWTSEGGMVSPTFATSPWVALGSRLTPRNLVVSDAANPSPIQGNGRLLVLVLPAAHGILAGDSLRLAARYADSLGNSSVGSSVWVPIRFGVQPIRVIARDRNGDGAVDDMEVRLTKSASGVPTPTEFGMTWNGATLKTATLVRSADQLSWRGSIGPYPPGTTPQSSDAGWIAVGTDVSSFRALVEDSVAPVATMARLVFGFEPGTADTLLISGSEGLVLGTGLAQALVGRDSGSTTATSVGSLQAVVRGGNLLAITVPAGTIPSDAGWARLGTAVGDGHTSVGASSRWVPLQVVPSGRAALFDANGDGLADSVHIAMRGSLVADRAEVRWCKADGTPDSRRWQVGARTGSFGLNPVNPLLQFEFGATSCASAEISFYDASNKLLTTWSLLDSVPPVLIGARLDFGTSVDTLTAKFSEPVQSTSGSPSWLSWKGAAVAGVPHLPAGASLAPDGRSAVLLLAAGVAPVELDSAQMAAGPLAGHLVDGGGVKPGARSPFVPIRWGVPPLTVVMADPNGIGTAATITVKPIRPVPEGALAIVGRVALQWDGQTRDQDLVRLGRSGTIWTGALTTPFSVGSTSCTGGCGAIAWSLDGISSAPATVVDSVPPALVRAQFRYSTREVAKDTLILDVSEPWVNGSPYGLTTPLVTGGRIATPKEVAPYLAWLALSDRRFVLVLDDTWEKTLRRGDSARLSANAGLSMVSDALGNKVGPLSPWVKIEYGPRPIELLIQQEHTSLPNGFDGKPAWPEPPPAVPGLELLVSDPDGNLVRVDQDLVVDPVAGQVVSGNPPKNDTGRTMGVRIKLNRPVDGTVFIYDNMGTSVHRLDLAPLRSLWQGQSEDRLQEVRITWNGTKANGKFVAGGVYFLRVFLRVDGLDGKPQFRNLLWKYAWKRPSK